MLEIGLILEERRTSGYTGDNGTYHFLIGGVHYAGNYSKIKMTVIITDPNSDLIKP
jgi:hypothetical protein